MIERYSIAVDGEMIKNQYSLEASPSPPFKEQYNCAPFQLLPVITDLSPQGCSFFYWGAKIFKENNVSDRLINVQMDHLEENSEVYRNMMKRRCIVPADGFYYIVKEDHAQQPAWRFQSSDDKLLSLAGIWEEFEEENVVIHTFKLMTRRSDKSSQMKLLQEPIILNSKNEKTWLNPSSSQQEVASCLTEKSHPLKGFPVSSKVMDCNYNQKSLLKPIQIQMDDPTLFG